MASALENYTAPVYEPISVESREVSLADFFSDDRTAQGAYVQGLFGLAACLAGLAIFWFACLFIMKWKDREVGCASGYGFDGILDSEEFSFMQRPTQTTTEEEDEEVQSEFNDEIVDDPFSPRCSWRSQQQQQPQQQPQNNHFLQNPHEDHVLTLTALEAFERHGISKSRSSTRRNMDPTDRHDSSCGLFSAEPYRIRKRRRRTRIVFLTFSLLSIISSILLLKKVRTPIEEAANDMSSLLVEGHAIVDRVQDTITVIEDAAEVTDGVIKEIPLDMVELCPNVPPQSFEGEFSVNPADVIFFLEQEFETFLTTTAIYIDDIQEMTWKARTVLTEAGTTVQENQDKLWVLSLWAGLTILMTSLMTAGVLVAICKDAKQSRRGYRMVQGETQSEHILSWIVLPALIILTIFGWCLLIATSASTVVTTDVCTAGDPGSPEAMIRQGMDASGLSPEEVTYKTIVAYTEGCRGDNPIQHLIDIENILDDNLVLMRDRIKEADAVGYDTMRERCGDANKVDVFFNGVFNLARNLNSVRTSVGEVTDALSCPNINSLYSRSVHNVLCTDVAAASANGFVLSFLVSTASMVMITLRSSWRLSR